MSDWWFRGVMCWNAGTSWLCAGWCCEVEAGLDMRLRRTFETAMIARRCEGKAIMSLWPKETGETEGPASLQRFVEDEGEMPLRMVVLKNLGIFLINVSMSDGRRF